MPITKEEKAKLRNTLIWGDNNDTFDAINDISEEPIVPATVWLDKPDSAGIWFRKKINDELNSTYIRVAKAGNWIGWFFGNGEIYRIEYLVGNNYKWRLVESEE